MYYINAEFRFRFCSSSLRTLLLEEIAHDVLEAILGTIIKTKNKKKRN